MNCTLPEAKATAPTASLRSPKDRSILLDCHHRHRHRQRQRQRHRHPHLHHHFTSAAKLAT